MSASFQAALKLFADDTPALDRLCAAAGVPCPPRPAPEEARLPRIPDWPAFAAECRARAEPSVRAVAGEDGPAFEAVAPLAAALVVLERVRDAKRAWTAERTLLLPEAFFAEAALSPDRLASSKACGQTRAVLDRVLDGADALLEDAALPDESPAPLRIVLCLARRMAKRLRRRDPLKRHLRLGLRDRLACRLARIFPGAGP